MQLIKQSRILHLIKSIPMRSLQTALLLLASSLIVTGLITLSIKADLEGVARQEFDFASNQITQEVKERFNAHAQILNSGAAVFAASENVSRQEWQAFAQHLSLESQFPGIQGLGYAVIIPAAQLPEHLQKIRAEGFPDFKNAGNVLRPYTAFKLSLRLPPLVDAGMAVQQLKRLLEDNAPYQARVTFEGEGSATGWNAPSTAPWFEQALNAASQTYFGAPCGYIGQGGTIPLMSLLSEGFPKAQMMVCGVLGPKSNAHGPNELLHVPYAKKLTAAVAHVIAQVR